MSVQTIANMIPMMTGVALLSENVRVVNKKKVSSKDIVKLGFTNMIGVGMISAQSQMLADL